ncbi:unnamed protein product, partial [Leptidea sinapis]
MIFTNFLRNLKNENVKIQNIVYPICTITSLIGLSPYQVKFSKTKQMFKIRSNSIYLNSLSAITILLILLTFFILHLRYLFSGTDESAYSNESAAELNYILELTTFVIFCCSAYYFVYTYRSSYMKMLNLCVTTWELMPSSNKRQVILKNLRFLINTWFIMFLLIIIVQVCLISMSNTSLWKKLLDGLTFNMAHVLQIIYLIFYQTLVMIIVSILRNLYCECQLMDTGDGVTNVKPKMKNMTLRQMEIVYIKAFELKTYINQSFQWPILMTTLQCFHAAVSEAHSVYHSILLNNTISIYEITDGTVQHFSTLIMYQSVEINLCGYFPLDATLIYN